MAELKVSQRARDAAEGIARIIDPSSWSVIDYWRSKPPEHFGPDLERHVARKAAPSLRKADAILAALPLAPREGWQEEVGELIQTDAAEHNITAIARRIADAIDLANEERKHFSFAETQRIARNAALDVLRLVNSPASLAVVLTEAERNTLLNGVCGVPRTNDEWSSDCICAGSAADALVDKGLAYRRTRHPNGVVLNTNGIAPRAALSRTGEVSR